MNNEESTQSSPLSQHQHFQAGKKYSVAASQEYWGANIYNELSRGIFSLGATNNFVVATFYIFKSNHSPQAAEYLHLQQRKSCQDHEIVK